MSTASPLPLTASPYARLNLSDDVAALLGAFDLTLSSLLTTSSAKATHTTESGIALSAMHYAMPHRALARAVNPSTVATTAPRAYIAALDTLARRHGLTDAAARYNSCPYATAGCSAACLAHSGHGGLSVSVQSARGRRTLAMVADPKTYARAMVYAVAAQLQRAKRSGLPLALRLNGTDESPWFARTFPVNIRDAERIRRRFGVDVEIGETLTIADAFSADRLGGTLYLYEYCKAPTDAVDGLRAWQAAGWDVTSSFAADRPTACRDAMNAARAGFRVAFPVALKRGAPIPSRVLISHNEQTVALETVDGDTTDARYRDPSGVAVILREKRARGADRLSADRFILPNAPLIRLSDGTIQLMP